MYETKLNVMYNGYKMATKVQIINNSLLRIDIFSFIVENLVCEYLFVPLFYEVNKWYRITQKKHARISILHIK